MPGIMWAPGDPGRCALRRNDVAHRPLVVAGDDGWPHPPPHGAWTDNDSKPIYFDSIDNSAYIMGKAQHLARTSWIYIGGETFAGARADVGDDPENPDLNIAWKYLFTAKDTWLGPKAESGGDWLDLQPDHGPIREIRHDVQRPGQRAHGDDLPWPLRRLRQWLGSLAVRLADHRVRQIHRRFPEHEALPRRGVERHESESARPGKPLAFDGRP